ncbi:MAG TPA: VWA domain-containing protein [bacterium]|nr:VWA domain-containing protein [bacterium]
MEFGWPVMLWALSAAPLLLWAYVHVQSLRARQEGALADPHLLPHVWTRPPAFHRHLPVSFYVAAVALLTLAMARPIAAVPLPTNRAALILAIDVSKSMIGEDAKPNRLFAAKAAAEQVLAAVPGSTKVGLLTFSDYAQMLVPPTTDRSPLREALARLTLQQATGVGSAILESLKALPGRREFFGDRLNTEPTQPGGSPPPPPPAATSPGPLPPAAVIIFSDGVSNFGVDPMQAAALAKEGNVRIFGVGVGAIGGSVMQVEGQLVLVPFDPTLLQQLALMTGGQYLDLSHIEDLRRAAQQLGTDFAWERHRTEVTALLTAVAGVFILTGSAFSLAWFRKVP